MEQQPQNGNRNTRRTVLWIVGIVFVLAAAVAIHYRGVKPIVTLEYGSAAPQASDYTAREATLAVDTPRPDPGWHLLDLKIGGVPTPVLLHVKDTVAPTAQPKNREVALGIALGPDAFLTELRDEDLVELVFLDQPDFDREGEQTVRIRMRDRSRNQSVVTVNISVRATHPTVAMEAGSEPPTVGTFLLDGVKGTLDRPIDPETMRHVGTTLVHVTTESGVQSVSVLTVYDSVAPTAKGRDLLLLPGETVTPEDCVSEASDATDLSYAFITPPDYARRDIQKVTVLVTDESQNAAIAESTVLISGVRPKEIEARRQPLSEQDFSNAEGDAVTVPYFVPDTPGIYAVEIETNGVRHTVFVTVVDTTPPVLTETPRSDAPFYTRRDCAPADFFTASDLSDVTLAFASEPDFSAAGEQTVSVTATDAYGNQTSAERTVVLVDDTEPPQIFGVIDRICYVNEPIAYFREAYAEDNADGTVPLTVDSEVVSEQTGAYRVTYRAVDRSGNEATCTCTFTLIEQSVTEEELRALSQAVMQEITTPDLTDTEKLRAIFDYVQKHVVYVNGWNHNYTDWRKAAYDGFTHGKGDCYNIYAVTRALLDETDIPYLSVERVRTAARRTRHYWVHVNVGTGWYVFDPTWSPKHKAYCFMWTERQCASFRLYWNFDKSKYPPLATEPFDYEAVVAAERQAADP